MDKGGWRSRLNVAPSPRGEGDKENQGGAWKKGEKGEGSREPFPSLLLGPESQQRGVQLGGVRELSKARIWSEEKLSIAGGVKTVASPACYR